MWERRGGRRGPCGHGVRDDAGAGVYPQTMTTPPIDDRIYALYDDFCHSGMERREFLRRAAGLGILGGASMAMSLLPDYAQACEVAFTDPRIAAAYVRFPTPGGNAEDMRAYLVLPTEGDGPFPAVLVVHENRGLNPYVEDVARRLAAAGFAALAPDALWAVGGYPGNDEEGKRLQAELDRDKILVDMTHSADFLRTHPRSNGKLGVVGFCFGGFVCNHLAVTMGDRLKAAAPFYGTPGDLEKAGSIAARMVLHYAEDDPRVNATRAGYEAALTKAKVPFASHSYPGTRHGFHNDSTPRYDPEAAKLAWERTVALFAEALG
jgi:carboxymethylenebutenolidase